MIPASIRSIDEIIHHIFNYFFFSKQDDWRDENEFRFIFHDNNYLKEFILEAIIVGHRFPYDKFSK